MNQSTKAHSGVDTLSIVEARKLTQIPCLQIPIEKNSNPKY